MKFAEVLIIETRVVEEARVKAEVKSAHIRALKARLREKKTWCQERVSGGSFMSERRDESEHKKNSSDEQVKSTWGQDDGGGRTARISISTTLFVEERPKAVEIPEAHEEVSSVVVLRSLGFAHPSKDLPVDYCIQLCKDAIERRASTTGCRERYPGDFGNRCAFRWLGLSLEKCSWEQRLCFRFHGC